MARRKQRRQEGNTYGKMLSGGWRSKEEFMWELLPTYRRSFE
jgi:hypothetical protein